MVLYKVCAGGRGEACAALFEGGSDVEARDVDGENVLYKVCVSGELVCV